MLKFKLGCYSRPGLSFQQVLSDFPWSIVSICIPQLGSKRVSILVGQFFPKKDFCFWAISVFAENVLVGTPYTFVGTSYELFWVGRAPLVGSYLKLPTVVGISFNGVGTSYQHCVAVIAKYVENCKKIRKIQNQFCQLRIFVLYMIKP